MASDAEESPAEGAPTLGDLLRNLLDVTTLPHLVLLSLSGFMLYLFATEDASLAFGVAGYISLSIGYALTGWLNEVPVVHRFSHVQPAPEGASFGERMKLYPLRVLASWLAPLGLSALPFLAIAWFLTSAGADQVEYWALAIASLFIVWSWVQGRAMANSLRIPIEARAARVEAVVREGRLKTSATTHILVIAVFAALSYWLFVIGYEKDRSLSLMEMLRMSGFAAFSAGLQWLLLHRTAERRAVDGARADTAVFGFTWGLLVQIFVTWHLLAAYRRFMGGSWGLGLVIEELLLMVLTVIAAIWTLAKDTHNRGLRIFTHRNAVFWGLSFGMAYAGSIAMIAVLGEELSGGIFDYGLSGSVGIGHLISGGTMAWIHWWRIGAIADWLDVSDEAPPPLDESVDTASETEEPEPEGEEDEEEEIELVDLDIPEPVTAENADQ